MRRLAARIGLRFRASAEAECAPANCFISKHACCTRAAMLQASLLHHGDTPATAVTVACSTGARIPGTNVVRGRNAGDGDGPPTPPPPLGKRRRDASIDRALDATDTRGIVALSSASVPPGGGSSADGAFALAKPSAGTPLEDTSRVVPSDVRHAYPAAGPPVLPSALDRTDAVLVWEPTSRELRASSLVSFATTNHERLCESGIAKVRLGAPRKLGGGMVPAGPEGVLCLLEAAGAPRRVHAYTYKLQQERPETNAWRICYSRSKTSVDIRKFCARVADAAYTELPSGDGAYWSRIREAARSGEQVTYPADVHCSVLDKGALAVHRNFNMALLSEQTDLLRAMIPHMDIPGGGIPGVTDTLLYIGAKDTTFFLHSEDQNLPSCNMLLAGAPKIWYAVPPPYYSRVIRLISDIFATHPLVKKCPQAAMHKFTLLHPDVLHASGIPTSRIVQYPGDLVLTAPGAFHFGYNTGLNLAEATNFATPNWWTGGHFRDAMAPGVCRCTENPRFHFRETKLRRALHTVGRVFGVDEPMPIVAQEDSESE